MMQDRRIISRWVPQKGTKKPPGGGKKKAPPKEELQEGCSRSGNHNKFANNIGSIKTNEGPDNGSIDTNDESIG